MALRTRLRIPAYNEIRGKRYGRNIRNNIGASHPVGGINAGYTQHDP